MQPSVEFTVVISLHASSCVFVRKTEKEKTPALLKISDLRKQKNNLLLFLPQFLP